ncbi:MAG: GvpL/GvpF family gas vesicle protein [Rhodobacteraceae bacterium]|jgi:hypothetical protein|nr:GvpL/GvpF family gas vesicle protein [Paracoccaceae bacterium]
MTPLALIAVLAATAERTLGEPGTTVVPAAGLLGLCIPAPDLATADAARQAVLCQHERLVRVALAHDLVPVRSGAVFSGVAAVAAALGAQAAIYRTHLERVSGALELTLSIVAPAPRVAAPGLQGPSGADGISYLRTRRPRPAIDQSQATDRLLADAIATVAPGLPVCLQPAQADGAAAATILVPRLRIAAVLSALERWTDEVAVVSGARVRLLGPWPCYAFTTLEVSHAVS